MTDERISFKDMSVRFGVTPRTLRHYEYIELLAPVREGRSRFYTSRDVARMTLILRGRRFGFSLEEIRQWFLIREEHGTKQQMQVALEATRRQIEVLQTQRDELDATIEELQDLQRDLSQITD